MEMIFYVAKRYSFQYKSSHLRIKSALNLHAYACRGKASWTCPDVTRATIHSAFYISFKNFSNSINGYFITGAEFDAVEGTSCIVGTRLAVSACRFIEGGIEALPIPTVTIIEATAGQFEGSRIATVTGEAGVVQVAAVKLDRTVDIHVHTSMTSAGIHHQTVLRAD